jgi:hypothetical protein
MTDRCELSDLPTEMCSHCRGLDKKPARQPAQMWTTARYNGPCFNCGDGIREGDQIGLVDGAWLCQRCAS